MDPVAMKIEQYEAVISMYNVMVAMQMFFKSMPLMS